MIELFKIAVITFLLNTTLHPAYSSELIHVYTENYPPYNMFDSDKETIIGKSTEIVRKTFEEAKISYHITLAPWARSLRMAETNKYTAVFSTAISPERENNFYWIGPLIINKWIFMGRKRDSIIINSLSDIKDHSIGTYRSDISYKFLTDKGFKIQVTTLDEQNALKLMRGRIDLWSTGIHLGPYLAKLHDVNGLEVIKNSRGEPFVFIEVGMYLALNKQTPVDIYERLNRAFKDLEKE